MKHHPFKIALILMAFYTAGAIQFFALQPGTAVSTAISIIAGLSASAVAFFLTKKPQRDSILHQMMLDQADKMYEYWKYKAQKQQDAEKEHLSREDVKKMFKTQFPQGINPLHENCNKVQ